jgi:hypothetical protein
LNTGQTLKAGHYSYYDGYGAAGSSPDFPGILDEIRVSSTAHSAQHILNDATGNTALSVTSYNPKEFLRDQASGQPLVASMTVNGFNLDGVTTQVRQNGQPIDVTATVVSSSFRQANLSISVPATAPLGMSQLVFSKPGQPDTSIDIRIGALAESVGDVDTLLLWHLNETGNGAVTIADAGPLNIYGTASSNSMVQPGHFGNGRAKASIFSGPDYGALTIGNNGFTAECWMKTGPLVTAYTLVGKDPIDGYYYQTDFALRILPTGGVRAYVFDTNKTQWKAEMSPLTMEVDDNQWHHMAMVVDRAANRLSIYIDGVERASSTAPANFGATQNAGQPFRAGHYAYYDGYNGFPEFPGTIDDVRLSISAHSAARIVRDMDAVPGLRIAAYTPKEVFRGTVNSPAATTINLSGWGLDGVTARVLQDGQPIDVAATVASSSFLQAQVNLSAQSTAPLGQAQLVLSKPGLPDASVNLQINQQTEYAYDADTRVLWHLNETGDGAVTIVDDTTLGLNGTANTISLMRPGHFGNGRARVNIFSGPDYGALALGSSSFTAECWMKTGPLVTAYTLVGKDPIDGYYYQTDFALRIIPGGGVRAYVFDTNKSQWKAEMLGHIYDQSTGRWQTDLEDNEWHHLAMVVDRTANRLIIYVDGVERASAAMPANFGEMQYAGQPFRAGHYAYYDGYNGIPEFPGTLDEVRLSTTAHTQQKIVASMQGTDVNRLNKILPGYIQRATGPATVTFLGYGLTGATVTTDQPDVTVNVTSSTLTSLVCSVNVPATVPIGQLHFTVTNTSGQSFPAELTIVSHQAFTNPAGTESLLLWHLDETGNGAVHINGSGDAVPTVIGGTANSISTAQPGHFGNGRGKANITADADNGALSLGSNSFTAECWMKTGPLVSAYTLAGKDPVDGYYYQTDFALRIIPGGGVRAYVFDTNKSQWKAEMLGRVYDPATGDWLTDLEDNRWHHLAMVVDRTANRLNLYVDGVERASAAMPANFGAMQNAAQPFRAGHYAYYDGYGGFPEFTGTLDEVRVLNYARTSAQMYDVFYGTTTGGGTIPTPSAPAPQTTSQPQLQISSVTPALVTRDRNADTPLVTNITIDGANLSGATARVLRDGQTLNGVVANVQDSTDTRAHVGVAVARNTPLGVAQLVLSRPGYVDAVSEIRVVEPGEFALEADTVGLWHLDERDEGVVHLLDASEHAINLTGAMSSRPAEGRFGGGRTSARATADANNTALAFGTSSFTVEGWVKSATLERDYVLIGKETNTGQNTDFTLKALSSGSLRAELYDTNGLLWQAETIPGTGIVTDGQWHSVALVVDRENALMLLYVDGQLHMVTPAPVGFAALRNLSQPLEFGCFDADGPAVSGPEEFPGVLDELRISSTAHNAEKIGADFFGHDETQVTLARPAAVRKGMGPVEVTLSGYGLGGANVRADEPGVTVAVISTTSTSIRLSVTLPAATTGGRLALTITDGLGRSTAVELNIADGPSGSRIGNPGTEFRRRASSAPDASSGQGRSTNESDITPDRNKRTTATSRISKASQDARPVGGQR